MSRVLTFTCKASNNLLKSCFSNKVSFNLQTRTYGKVTHCIFDLDGLLLNTEILYKKAFAKVVAEQGKKYTNEVMLKHVGSPCEIGSKIIIDELKLNITVAQFVHRFHEIAHKLIGDCELMPGAQIVVDHLVKNKIPIAIATSSEEPGFSIKTKKHKKFLSNFHHIILSSADPDVKKGKPHPDIYLVAAKRFKEIPPPTECLAFEDSVNGVKAAISAKMQCIMVPDPVVPENLRKEATLVVKKLDDVPFEQFGIPALKQKS